MAANTETFGSTIEYTFPMAISISAGIAKGIHLKYDGSAVAGATDDTAGVTLTAATNGQTVDCQKFGIALCAAGAALSAGNQVKLNASGQVIAFTAGARSRGVALDDAGAAGDMIRVLLEAN